MTALDGNLVEGAAVGPATSADELPVYLVAGAEHLFGILTRPTVEANGTAVLCLHAGAQNLTSHRNRVYTRLCRELAGAGYTAFRMDFHGSGDSSGILGHRRLPGQTTVDVDGAVRWLVEQGARRVVVVGTCWGGLVALLAAARHDVVAAACLISPPLGSLETGASESRLPRRPERLGRALAQLMRPHVFRMFLAERQYRAWLLGRLKRRLARGLRARSGGDLRARQDDDHAKVTAQNLFTPLLRRRVPIRVLYGEQDPTYLGLQGQNALPLLEAASEIIDMTVTPVAVHGLNTLRAQETVLRFVRECLAHDGGARDGGARDVGSA